MKKNNIMKKNNTSFKKIPLDKLPEPKINSYINNDFKESNITVKKNEDKIKTVDKIFTKEFIDEYFD